MLKHPTYILFKKAEMYKKVFGECCDTPQSCCCNPTPTAP